MPILIQDINEQEEPSDCPLCMEPLEADDINFFPCECGYQICRFCWHRIRTDENGLCPACRKAYPENPAEFKPLSEQELLNIRLEKKQREVARKQKITDSRKHLANVRVLQKNLVFVVGLSQRLADVEILKRQEYFGKYGKILKVVLNSNTSYAGTQAPSCSAYVTYSKMEESLRAIQSVNNVHIDGRTLKASLGTTKYCSNYLKNQQCMKADCMYLHEIGDEEASFTKEDMQMAKHQEYEQKLIQQMIQKEIAVAQQETRKALRQEEDTENGHASAGSSPPNGSGSGTITQGLSVAQAVKKNVKGANQAGPRTRRHSGTVMSNSIDAVEDGSDQVSGTTTTQLGNKGPRLASSLGDKDPGVKGERSKTGTRRSASKKSSNSSSGSQAPRHKKQQMLQSNNSKNSQTRAKSASPSAPNLSGSGGDQSPSSIPLSTGTSADSSPSVTPLRDDLLDSNKPPSVEEGGDELDRALHVSSNKMALNFGDERRSSDTADETRTLPIDIPILTDAPDGTQRVTTPSDAGSSLDRRSPYINTNLPPGVNMNSIGNQQNLSTNFMMLHKSAENPQNANSFPTAISNGLCSASYQTSTNVTAPPFSQDPRGKSLPPGLFPPGLSGFPPSNSGWPPSNNLSDSIPIQSTNDWEAAFGFKSSNKEPEVTDDDLGFDPFLECSKGLADLMEKESMTQERSAPPNLISNPYLNPQHSTTFSGLAGPQRHQDAMRPTMHSPNTQQLGYQDQSSLINGFSNLLIENSSRTEQHKMPFGYDMQSQMERTQFSHLNPSQQRDLTFGRNPSTESSLQQLFASVKGQKLGLHSTSLNPRKELHTEKKNLQEWQNGLRALLPSVNINFAMQDRGQTQQKPRLPDSSSLGLSGLGLGGGSPMPKLSRPPGMPHPLNSDPFNSKQMPPPGFPPGRSSQMSAQGWGGLGSSFSTPNMSSSQLMSPSSLQMLFASGGRSESNPIPSYPPDPAIVRGGENQFAQRAARQSRLFELAQNRSSGTSGGINSNNNSNEEQPPHWMKSLQALTEPESPMSAPEHNNVSPLNALFSQRQSNLPPWPSMSGNAGLFSSSGMAPVQPPPGFQVRPSLSKPTEFGMTHNLLENQS